MTEDPWAKFDLADPDKRRWNGHLQKAQADDAAWYTQNKPGLRPVGS